MSGEINTFFDLSGRVAVVTGGGSGLGREFCDVLAEFGADILCPDLYKERAEETCEMIKKYGHRTMAIGVDVSKYDEVKAMFNHLEKTWGRLDILVNNAGITTVRPILHKMDVMSWQKVIDVDLHGVFYCMKEGLGMMIKQKKGSIINITSIAGLRHAHGTGDGSELGTNIAYVTAKTGVVGLTKRAAAEYGSYGIRVNGIAPGQFAWTRLPESRGVKPLTEEERRKAREGLVVTSGIPLKRTGKPEEIRSLLLYLASDASSYITGQIIADDGGATCL